MSDAYLIVESSPIQLHPIDLLIDPNNWAANLAAPYVATDNAQIASLYVAYFGRAGDPGGMNYWLDALAHGASLQSIAASFSVQREAQAQYPFLADPVHASSGEVQDFISQIYQNLFGRTPEAGGLAYWQNSLEANLGNPQAIGTFILAVAKGAQGSDQTTLANKIFAAEFFTSTLSSHNVAFDAAGECPRFC